MNVYSILSNQHACTAASMAASCSVLAGAPVHLHECCLLSTARHCHSRTLRLRRSVTNVRCSVSSRKPLRRDLVTKPACCWEHLVTNATPGFTCSAQLETALSDQLLLQQALCVFTALPDAKGVVDIGHLRPSVSRVHAFGACCGKRPPAGRWFRQHRIAVNQPAMCRKK